MAKNNTCFVCETSISPAIIAEYSRCSLGKRCIFKTSDSSFFRKFTLLVAISNKLLIDENYNIINKYNNKKLLLNKKQLENLKSHFEHFIDKNQLLIHK